MLKHISKLPMRFVIAIGMSIEMIIETLIICIALYAIFGEYYNARAAVLREDARKRELENDKQEVDA